MNVELVWIMLSGVLILLMQIGFLCLETGVTQAKHTSGVALKNVSDLAIVCLGFWAVGYALMFGTSAGGFFGTSSFFFDAPTTETTTIVGSSAFFFFQMTFASSVATILSGAVAERVRFPSYLMLSMLIGVVIYPIVGHWAWFGATTGSEQGWLRTIGFYDLAGSTVIHGVGGWATLAVLILIGPRRGRFSKRKREFEPSNLSLSAIGIMLLWIGWAGFVAGNVHMLNASVSSVVFKMMLAGAAGGMMALLYSFLFHGIALPKLLLNGIIAGLVAVTAGADVFSPFDAVMVGAGGALAMIIATNALSSFKIDDAVGAVPVHLAAGIWGTLAVAFFGDIAILPSQTRLDQLVAQLTGIAVVGIWSFSVTFIVAFFLKVVGKLRITPRAEVMGINLSEHGQKSALQIFLDEMRFHMRTGNFSARAKVDNTSEVGILAHNYNQVLDRVEFEINERMEIMHQEKNARKLAERATELSKQMQRKLAHAARHDALTGLGNRLLLDEIIQNNTVQQGDKLTGKIVCVCVDLDYFKEVNDTYGHAAGDAVLVASASRIQNKIQSKHDLAFRIGGDEFVVLIEIETQNCAEFVSNLQQELCKPVEFKGVPLRVGASLGYARVQEAGQSLREIVHRADIALYRAKEMGRNTSCAYSDSLGRAAQIKIKLLNDFKQAIDQGQIELAYQPQFSTNESTYSGCEVLARWRHPEFGLMHPTEFLPIAAELDLLDQLDRYVFDQVLDAVDYWETQCINVHRLALNVSAQRLASRSLIEELRGRTLPKKTMLAFEVLECTLLEDSDQQLRNNLSEIRRHGIEIDLDDFGTRHASIASLYRLKPNRLKLASMFVEEVASDRSCRTLTAATISLAHSFNTVVVADKVEHATQAHTLKLLGADILQGFAFEEPMSAKGFAEWASDEERQLGVR